MSRSPVIGTLLILAIFIASDVLSAPREERIPQKFGDQELVKTRQAEVLEQRTKRLLRNDVSKEYEVLHRRPRMPKEPVASSNENEEKSSETKKSTKIEETHSDSRSNGESLEIKDMNESHVTPQDDDDNTKDGPKLSTKVTEHPIDSMSDSKNSAPNVFPDDDRVHSISDASPAMIDRLNKTNYTIDGTNITKSAGQKKELISDTVNVVPMKSPTIPPTIVQATTILPPSAASTTTNRSESITTLAPAAVTEATTEITTAAPKTTIVVKISTTTTEPSTIFADSEFITDVITPTEKSDKSSSPSPAEQLLHTKKMPEPPPLMPRGVVALITAISFTIIAVTVYIGHIVRRRFIEWRHGNRELLVNEFDATDISNFEL